MTEGLAVLTKAQIATLAVFLLGGEAAFVDREDVGLKAQELVPNRFGWHKHPRWVDLEAVACALRDAKKPRYGALLVSNGRTGWMLATAGLDAVAHFCQEFGVSYPELHLRWQSMEEKRGTERERMRSTKAFRLFMTCKTDQMTVDDYHEFAKVNEYFGRRTRLRRLTYMANVVHGDESLESLWAYLVKRFGGNQHEDHQDQRHIPRSA